MSRAKFEVRDYGRCVVLTTPAGETREFHIPYTTDGRGYVREGSNMGPQVCDRLSHSGNTLSASADTLLAVIRREWRAARADERRDADARW